MRKIKAGFLNYFWQRDRGQVLSLLGAVLLVYLPFLNTPFFFDDLPFFSGPSLNHYTDSLFQVELRWFPYVTLGWTWAFFGDEPHLYRLGNVLLHAANVVLLFFWLRQLTLLIEAPNNEAKRFVKWGVWLGALVFACHPVAVYAVGYVVQRSILMATLFTLVVLLAYMRGVVSGQYRWLVLAVVAYFFAVFSKEHSVMAPAVAVALTILFQSKVKVKTSALWVTWTAFLAVGLLVLLRVKGVLGVPYELAFEVAGNSYFTQELDTEHLYLLSILTQAGLFFKYVLLWWLPNPAWMSIDMREPFVSSLGLWRGWVGGAGFVFYGVLAVWLLLKRGLLGLLGFALLYPWLMFLVEFSSIRVQEPFVLYRSYLWFPGMMLFFPVLLARFSGRKMLAALLVITIGLMPLAWNRLWVFTDEYRLWNDAALLLKEGNESGVDRIFYNRGIAELTAKKWGEAAIDFQRVIAHSPKIEQAHVNLGSSYFALKRYQDAIQEFDKAIALKPDYADAYFNKGLAYKRRHNEGAALEQLAKSCKLGNQMGCVIISFNKAEKKK